MIGVREGRTELVYQRRRPRVAVRLKSDNDPPAERPRGAEYRSNLGRMMAVVVNHENAVRFAAHLEPPLDSTEIGQARRNALERQVELQPNGDGRQRVLQVVSSRHVQRQRTEYRSR